MRSIGPRKLEKRYPATHMIIQLDLYDDHYSLIICWEKGNVIEKGIWQKHWPWSKKTYYLLIPTDLSQNILSYPPRTYRREFDFRGKTKLLLYYKGL